MKLLLFTDSLSLPRTEPEVCLHRDTWPELLRQQGHEVCLSAIGGATIKELYRQTFYYKKTTYFDAVIVQSGIVDCAPRFARRWEIKLLQQLPLIGKKVLQSLNNTRVRRIRKLTYTTPKTFDRYLSLFASHFSCPVYFLSIAPVLDAYEMQLPGIRDQVQRFNGLIENYPSIDLSDLPADGLMSDFHHLNTKGHRFLVEKITKQLSHGLS